MKTLALEFPGSTLIFATLKEELLPAEIISIKAMVQSHRSKRLRGQANSPIIILTGTELFSSDGAPECWRGKSGDYDNFSETRGEWSNLFSVADATQQLYLGLPSWFEWSEAERTKRRTHKKGL